MNPKTETTQPALTPLAGIYRLLQPELDSVADLMRSRLAHGDPAIREILDYSLRLGGKRLRPILVLLCGQVIGETVSEDVKFSAKPVGSDHFACAAAVELIHTGTLIHDDILDGARVRRHLETINLRWNSKLAVLAGDYLLTVAMALLSERGDPECNRMITGACQAICEGELLQTSSQGNFDLTRDLYYRIIRGKTASLLEVSCRLGAHFSGADSETVERLGHYGRHLGLAFQILDDILDLIGTEDAMGKTLRTDLLNQKPTLPLIHYLAEADPAERKSTLEILRRPDFSDKDHAVILKRLENLGSVATARREATVLIDKAIEFLPNQSPTAASSSTTSIDSLRQLASFVLSRNF